jgi:hypothetical protein
MAAVHIWTNGGPNIIRPGGRDRARKPTNPLPQRQRAHA